MLTALSCRALAAEDRLRASEQGLDNRQRLLRASADAWDQRAALLDRIAGKSLPGIGG